MALCQQVKVQLHFVFYFNRMLAVDTQIIHYHACSSHYQFIFIRIFSDIILNKFESLNVFYRLQDMIQNIVG